MTKSVSLSDPLDVTLTISSYCNGSQCFFYLGDSEEHIRDG